MLTFDNLYRSTEPLPSAAAPLNIEDALRDAKARLSDAATRILAGGNDAQAAADADAALADVNRFRALLNEEAGDVA